MFLGDFMVDKVEKVRKGKDLWVRFLFDHPDKYLITEFRSYCRSHPWLSKNRCARYVLLHHFSSICKPGHVLEMMRYFRRRRYLNDL